MNILTWIAGIIIFLYIIKCIVKYIRSTTYITNATPERIAKAIKDNIVAGKTSFTIKHDYIASTDYLTNALTIDSNIIKAIKQEDITTTIEVELKDNKVIVDVL